jgi:hypothetical protein
VSRAFASTGHGGLAATTRPYVGGDAQAGRIVDGRWTRMPVVQLRLAYLPVTNGLAMLRLLPMSDGAKDVEILALRHQLAVLERQLHGLGHRVRFAPTDRAFLAALLHRLHRQVLHRVRLLVRPGGEQYDGISTLESVERVGPVRARRGDSGEAGLECAGDVA